MRIIDDLNPTQVRILGALLEKEQATPEYYPLTVNALLAACNQKSNRHPVTSLTETELWDELEALRAEVLVWRSEGARAQRWSQSISRRLELDAEEKAILTVLMLRGPQTIGEVRSRSQRLYAFSSLEEVESALRRMATEERDLVAELPRQPGRKERRWAQLLGGEVEERAGGSRDSPAPGESDLSSVQDSPARLSRSALEQRIEALEARVDELQETLAELLRQLG